MPETAMARAPAARPALVLGASRGIGRAIAEALGRAGFPVGVACRSDADAAAVAGAIDRAGGRALPLVADVTDLAAVGAAVAAFADAFGGLAALVNNAGVIGPIGHIPETDPAAWAQAVTVNLVGAYHGIHAALPHMTGGGVIVNVSSGAAGRPQEGWSAYCASKAGLAMLTRSLHLEYGGRGIRAYGFRPGVVDTAMQGTIRASGLNPVSRIPRETLSAPEVPARGVAWLVRAAPDDLAGEEVDIRDPAFLARMEGTPWSISQSNGTI